MTTRSVAVALFYVLALSAACGARAQSTANAPDAQVSKDAQTGQSSAAVPAAGSGELQEIIVTAEKRSERLQDVPMSLNVETGNQLQTLGIISLDQLGKAVPGFTLDKTYYGLPIYYLRGVGFNDTSLGVSPAVSVYTDQLPIPFSPMARGAIMDLEHVEVLKGPQGTLFGENSTGGAINFIAAKPTDHPEAGFDLTYGRFNAVDAEGFVSGPITDTISARFAVQNESGGDWQRGYTTDEHLGDQEFHNARLLVDWRPTGKVKVELSATGWQDKSEVQQGQFVKFTPLVPAPFGRPLPYPIQTFPPAPNDDRAAAWDPGDDFRKDDHFYQLGARIDVELTDQINLTSLTSYADYDQSLPTDFDTTTYPLGVNTDDGQIQTFSQEIRLSGSSVSDRVKWMVGGNYERDRVDEQIVSDPNITTANSIGPFDYDAFDVDNLQRIETKAAFGSLDFKLVDTLTAQGSVRYTDQDRDFQGCLRDSGNGQLASAFGFLSTGLSGIPQTIAPGSCVTLSAATATPLPIVTGNLDQNNVSWRGSLNWKPDGDTLLYGNVTKGYKAGGFSSIPYVFTTQANPVPQESVLAYELGTKLSGFSRKLQLDAATFWYNYTDKQLNGYVVIEPFGALPSLVSIPKSTIKGAEISATLLAIDGLTLSANGTYIVTRIDSNPVNPIGAFGNTASFIGQSFPNTPKWQGVFDAQYGFAVTGNLDAYIGSSVSAHSPTNGQIVSGAPAVAADEDLLKIPSYALLDLRAGLENRDGSWRVELWGRNVTDKFYLTGTWKGADTVGRDTGMPATFGIGLHYRYR